VSTPSSQRGQSAMPRQRRPVTALPAPDVQQPGSSLSRRELVEALLGFVVLGGFVVAAVAACFAMPVEDVRVTTVSRAFALAVWLAMWLAVVVFVTFVLALPTST